MHTTSDCLANIQGQLSHLRSENDSLKRVTKNAPTGAWVSLENHKLACAELQEDLRRSEANFVEVRKVNEKVMEERDRALDDFYDARKSVEEITRSRDKLAVELDQARDRVKTLEGSLAIERQISRNLREEAELGSLGHCPAPVPALAAIRKMLVGRELTHPATVAILDYLEARERNSS